LDVLGDAISYREFVARFAKRLNPTCSRGSSNVEEHLKEAAFFSAQSGSRLTVASTVRVATEQVAEWVAPDPAVSEWSPGRPDDER
jgi:hypothetical protein